MEHYIYLLLVVQLLYDRLSPPKLCRGRRRRTGAGQPLLLRAGDASRDVAADFLNSDCFFGPKSEILRNFEATPRSAAGPTKKQSQRSITLSSELP